MAVKIKVEMKPVNQIIARLGLDPTGDVQEFVTNDINKRITRYMPYRSSAMATKLRIMSGDNRHLSEGKKKVTSPTEITVAARYATYQYYGKVMVGTTPKVATDKPLTYSKHKHPLAGPLWDRHLMANEGDAIAADVQRYIERRKSR